MLYAVPYNKKFSSRSEEAAYQRELSRTLLHWAVKREYGKKYPLSEIVYGSHGKPAFSNSPVKFSLSHCRGLACCALGAEEVGVDAEAVRPFDLRLARRICTPEEWEFLSSAPNRDEALILLWTLKESLMKLTGKGIGYGFRNAAFMFRHDKPVPALAGVQAASFRPVPGVLLSICCRGEPPKELKLQELPELFRNQA